MPAEIWTYPNLLGCYKYFNRNCMTLQVSNSRPNTVAGLERGKQIRSYGQKLRATNTQQGNNQNTNTKAQTARKTKHQQESNIAKQSTLHPHVRNSINI